MYSYKTYPQLYAHYRNTFKGIVCVSSTDWENVAVLLQSARGRQLGKYSAVKHSANISSFCILL